jgi:hypothetical protein
LTITIAVLTATSCTSPKDEEVRQEIPSYTSDCIGHEVREACNQIDVEGNPYRYSIHTAGNKETRQTVVVDLGGPGIPILSGDFLLSSFAKDNGIPAGDYNLLFIEEPWVTQPFPTHCRLALENFYESARNLSTQHSGNAITVSNSCELQNGNWGHHPEIYQSAVQKISTAEDLDIVGFLGHSFGSVRWSYLKDVHFEWAILVNPFPLNTDLKEIIDHRGDGTAHLLGKDSNQAFSERAHPEPFDTFSASLQLGYLEESRRSALESSLWEGDAEAISQASNDTWSSYSDSNIYPSYLALLEETCKFNFNSLPSVESIKDSKDILYLLHSPCTENQNNNQLSHNSNKICIATSEHDIVSSHELVKRTFENMMPQNQTTIVETTEENHSSMAGLSDCLGEII